MSQPLDTVIDYANPRAGQPFDSRTVFEQHADGISYTFLPDGLAGATRSLTAIGAFALAVLLFPILILFGVVTEDETGMSPWVPLVVLVPLAALVAGVVRSATRPTVLSLRGGRVTLFSGAALLRPVQSWPIEDVESVSVNVRGVTERLRLSADLNLHLRRGRETVLVIAGRAARSGVGGHGAARHARAPRRAAGGAR